MRSTGARKTSTLQNMTDMYNYLWDRSRPTIVVVENVLFWAKIHIFWNGILIFCYHHDSSPKRQHFCADPVAIGSKKQQFWLKKGHIRQSLPENGPPSSPMDTYWKTEGIQSYLRIWVSYDPIESGPSEAKKGGYVDVAQKKTFSGQYRPNFRTCLI